MPIWIADYVLMTYGTGAIMAVPAHDERDFEFALKFGLPIREVIAPPSGPQGRLKEAYVGPGTMVNSGEFDGLDSRTAFERICDSLERKGQGKRAVKYRLRDWLISRQRYWGCPIPIVYCETDGMVMVPQGPAAGGAAEGIQASRRAARFLSRRRVRSADATRGERRTRWTRSSIRRGTSCATRARTTTRSHSTRSWRITGCPSISTRAASSTRSCTCCTRGFFIKVLHDAGMVEATEPFVRLFNQGMVKRFGQVMSKSAGNGVSPDELVAKQGADAGRVYEMFIGPPEEDVEWTDAGLNGVARFLQRVWRLVVEPTSIAVEGGGADATVLARKAAQTVKKVTDDYDALRFNTAVAYLMELANAMQDYLQRGGTRDAGWDRAVQTLLKLLNPVAPHVCEEMWERLDGEGLLADASWPEYDAAIAAEPEVTVVVQVGRQVARRG